jgi:HEAT repeat protein
MTMRLAWLLLIAALAAGCGKKEPFRSHGQPVSYWVQALHEPDVPTRKKAVVALGHVGPADPAAMPALIGALKDADPDVRAEAVLALLNLGAEAKDAIPALTEARDDPDARVRDYARRALERIQGGN